MKTVRLTRMAIPALAAILALSGCAFQAGLGRPRATGHPETVETDADRVDPGTGPGTGIATVETPAGERGIDDPRVTVAEAPETEIAPKPGEISEPALRGEEILVADPFPGEQVREARTEAERRVFRNIHFDYDSYEIQSEARPILEGIAAWMAQNPAAAIVIEGHCDERGTEEYNMALGERRALAARRYLAAMGVAVERMATLSYGKERPLVARSDEEAWSLNRRCEFRIVDR